MPEQQSQEYHGNGKHTYENVVRDVQGVRVERLRVPHGWIYTDRLVGASVFVPMPEIVKHKV